MSRRKRIIVSCIFLAVLAGLYALYQREDPNLRRMNEILRQATVSKGPHANLPTTPKADAEEEQMVFDVVVALIPQSKNGKRLAGMLDNKLEILEVLTNLAQAGEAELVTMPKISATNDSPILVRIEDGTVTAGAGPPGEQPGTTLRCQAKMLTNDDVLLDLQLNMTRADTQAFVLKPQLNSTQTASTVRIPQGKTYFMVGPIQKAILTKQVDIPLLADLHPAFSFTYTKQADLETLVVVTARQITEQDALVTAPAPPPRPLVKRVETAP